MPYKQAFAFGITPREPSVYIDGSLRRVVGITGVIRPTDLSLYDDTDYHHVVLSAIIFFPQIGNFSDIGKKHLWAEVGIIALKSGDVIKNSSLFFCYNEQLSNGDYAWIREFKEDDIPLNQDYAYSIYISGSQVYFRISSYQKWFDYSFLTEENRKVLIACWNGEYKSYVGNFKDHLHGRFGSCAVKVETGEVQSFIPKLKKLYSDVYYPVRDSQVANAFWVHGGVG